MSDMCKWEQYDDDWGAYETDCGQAFNIIDGTPEDNRMKFCCYCGKPLLGKPFDWGEEDEA